jgi:hypothetical protein
VLWIRIRIRIEFARLDPDPEGQKRPTKRQTGGLSCSLGNLHGGLVKNVTIAISDKKTGFFLQLASFFLIFDYQIPGSGSESALT